MNVHLNEDDGIGFGRRLGRLGTAWRREVDHELRRFGLTDASWRPILALGGLDEPIRQGDLARLLAMDAPSLARLLEALERDGLIERAEDPADRRGKLVRITNAGQAIHAEVARQASVVANRLLADVPPADLAICQAVFERIEQALRSQPLQPGADGDDG